MTGEYTNIYIGHISETNRLLKQLFLTVAISSYKIADQSELISHTLATGLWRLLKYTIKTGMIYSHVVTCTWQLTETNSTAADYIHAGFRTSYSI